MKFITGTDREQMALFPISLDAARQNIEEKENLYRRRQAIVEHPFGIIKRQWGFYFKSTKKTIQHASADVGLIFTAYNLRRIFNLIDKDILKDYLRSLFFNLSGLRSHFKLFKTHFVLRFCTVEFIYSQFKIL